MTHRKKSHQHEFNGYDKRLVTLRVSLLAILQPKLRRLRIKTKRGSVGKKSSWWTCRIFINAKHFFERDSLPFIPLSFIYRENREQINKKYFGGVLKRQNLFVTKHFSVTDYFLERIIYQSINRPPLYNAIHRLSRNSKEGKKEGQEGRAGRKGKNIEWITSSFLQILFNLHICRCMM